MKHLFWLVLVAVIAFLALVASISPVQGTKSLLSAAVTDAATQLGIPDEPQPGSGTLVAVEPRAGTLLKSITHMFHKAVPGHWDVVLFHGTGNAEECRDIAESLRGKRNVTLVNLRVDNLSADMYNYLLLMDNFWRCVRGDHVLIYQTDTVPCKPLDVGRFSKFGFIGCTLHTARTSVGPGTWGDWVPREMSFYGIGGLSFRRKKFCLQACRFWKGHDVAEDVAFATYLDHGEHEFLKPTADDLESFCAQHNFGKRPRSFGAHKITDSWMRDKDRFYEYCPSSKLI